METQFYYIHGLNGSKNSTKFLELKKYYPNIECFEWFVGDNIPYRIRQWKKIIENLNKKVCVIASSTGANFAYQLQLELRFETIKTVYINPLFDIEDLIDQTFFPNQLKQHILKIKCLLTDSLVFLGDKDEVLRQNNSVFMNSNQVVVCKKSSHKFEYLYEYLNFIDNYIAKKQHCEVNFILFQQLQISYLKLELDRILICKKNAESKNDFKSLEINRVLEIKKTKLLERRFSSIIQFYNEIEISVNNLKFKEEVFRFSAKQEQFVSCVINQAISNRIKNLLKSREIAIKERKNAASINQEIRKIIKHKNLCLLDFL